MKSESCSAVSNSLPHHGLPSPWNPIDQNTGVGSSFLSPGDLPNPGIEPRSPTLQGDSSPAEPQGKPKSKGVGSPSHLQRIFPTQRSSWGLLHFRRIPYQLSCRGSHIKVSFLHWHFSQVWISESLSLISFLLLPLSLWQSPICSLHLLLCFSFVICFHLFCFSDSTHKWNHMMLVFLWLIFLHIIPSGSTRVVTDGKFFFFFFTAWVSFHFICMCVSVCVCVCVYVCVFQDVWCFFIAIEMIIWFLSLIC